MMRYIFILFLLLIFQSSFSQQISYEQWKEQAKTDIRLLPEYGNAPKTKEQKESDDELIQTELKIDTSHHNASENLVKLGFSYLYRGDIKTAMYRFNQAWLLDPKNENVYWGYGAIYGSFNDYPKAIAQYDKGLVINPNSSVILTDKATLYFVGFQQDNNQNKLNMAIDLLKKSYTIDANSVNTTFKLSVCYFLNKDCTNAWRFYTECAKLGGKPITQDYTDALRKMCPK